MVGQVSSLTGSGLKDWCFQRISAVLIAVYSIYLVGFILSHPRMSYQTWHGLFSHVWFQVFTLGTLLAFLVHAWVGIWTVTTDYIKCFYIRMSVQLLVCIIVWGSFFWGVEILWGMPV